MNRWLRRLRGALGMGITWGVAWALMGILIGVSTLLGVPMGWFMEVFDAPLPALMVPGFFCGASFSLVLGIAGRRRRFDELSLPRFGFWGALGGLLLGLPPVLAVASGGGGAQTIIVALGTLGVLSGASAMGTLALARLGEDRDRLGGRGSPPRAGWAEAARALHDRREDALLDEIVPTEFDEKN